MAEKHSSKLTRPRAGLCMVAFHCVQRPHSILHLSLMPCKLFADCVHLSGDKLYLTLDLGMNVGCQAGHEAKYRAGSSLPLTARVTLGETPSLPASHLLGLGALRAGSAPCPVCSESTRAVPSGGDAVGTAGHLYMRHQAAVSACPQRKISYGTIFLPSIWGMGVGKSYLGPRPCGGCTWSWA